jgi:hypothetical protein
VFRSHKRRAETRSHGVPAGALCGSTGGTHTVEISIDDLEAIAASREAKIFEPGEDEVIMKYWGRVPIKTLLQYLNQNFKKSHTLSQLKHRRIALTQRSKD